MEATAPNSGDGNADGLLDFMQRSVASIPSLKGSFYTLELSATGVCTTISDFSATTESILGSNDLYDYPLGLNEFSINCASSVDIVIYYHAV
ncbi:MAG: hypothetical protein H6765_01260 [Candidatus Peribacteria bacterium]|nr:MAG: hypothetical protein H6765_01260 [Candidatus Peribacteria bacterium]